jgi:ribosomal RNA assembly protein
MQEIYSECVRKINEHKKRLERELKVVITSKNNIVFVEGKAEDEYMAISVIEAINLGFTIQQALILTQNEFILEKINIKGITKRHDLGTVRGRVVGSDGKTKRIIEGLGDCLLSLHDNTVGIIGRADEIQGTLIALTSLIKGKKQAKVYSYLERQKNKEKTQLNEDLGLKIKDKRNIKEKE